MEERKEMLTQEGYDKLLAELDERKTTVQAEIEEKLRVARSYGDLSENAEYDAAKEAQADNARRIDELEEILKNVTIIDENILDSDTVNIGHVVEIQDTKSKEKYEFQIVGSKESNPLSGKISNESPVGKALVGAKKGQTVEVAIPDGVRKYKILKFSKKEKNDKKEN